MIRVWGVGCLIFLGWLTPSAHGSLFSVGKSGADSLSVSGPRGIGSASVRLPRGSEQLKRDARFILQMKYRISLRPLTIGRESEVAIDLNGEPTLRVTYRTVAAKNCPKSQGYRWASVDWVNGIQSHFTCGPLIEADAQNVVPYGSVKGGRNRISLEVREASRMVRELRVRRDSGIRIRSAGPPTVAIRPGSISPSPEAGKEFVFEFNIVRESGVVAKNVRYRVDPGDGLVFRGPTTGQIKKLAHEKTIQVRAIASTGGDKTVSISVGSPVNNPSMKALIAVDAGSDSGISGWKIAIGLGALLLFGGLASEWLVRGRQETNRND